MTVRLRHLQFAIAAAHHGSFRRAAAALYVRQSTISRAIRELEEHLGVAFFVRSSTGIRLTSAGTEFLKRAKRLLDDFDALVSRAEALGSGAAGHLTLGLPTSHSVVHLRPVLLDYGRERPGVDIRLTSTRKQTLLADLKDETLDVAIVTGRVHEEGIESLSLWSEQILLVVLETHSLASRDFANWTDLIDEVVLISRNGVGPDMEEILTANAAVLGGRPRIERHAIGVEALASLVLAGRGVSLQCESTIHALPAGLTTLEMHDRTGPTWLVHSVCWSKHHANPSLPSFLALLRAHRSMLSRGRVPNT